jgi:hypothetical protein
MDAQALKMYEDAASKSTKHPVVCYSYGMFRLMHSMYPRDKVWAEAQVRQPHRGSGPAARGSVVLVHAFPPTNATSCGMLRVSLGFVCVLPEPSKHGSHHGPGAQDDAAVN